MRQVFAVAPARALADPRVKDHHLRAFLSLGVHASALGICCATLKRLGAVVGRSQSWAFRYVGELQRMGYVPRLRSGSKRKRHAIWR
jgi:hypothetical protein